MYPPLTVAGVPSFVYTDPVLLNRVAADVRASFTFDDGLAFIPQWILVVTWKDVTFNGGNANIVSMNKILLNQVA
jgi:hypothetical protein